MFSNENKRLGAISTTNAFVSWQGIQWSNINFIMGRASKSG
jgi:hypothetical protein